MPCVVHSYHGVCPIPRISATQSSEPFHSAGTAYEMHGRTWRSKNQLVLTANLSQAHENTGRQPRTVHRHPKEARDDVRDKTYICQSCPGERRRGKAQEGVLRPARTRALAPAHLCKQIHSMHSAEMPPKRNETLGMLMNIMLMCDRTSAALHRMQALCTRRSSVQQRDLKRLRDPSRLGLPSSRSCHCA